ncbi:MAG TPA: ATP-binding protein [Caulobacteraceae bacterium]
MSASKLAAVLAGVCAIALLALVGPIPAASLTIHCPPALAALLIVAVVALGYGFLRQRFAMQRMAEDLSTSLAEKNRAIAEMQQRRLEAEQAYDDAERTLERLGESEALYRLVADNQTDVITLWTAEMGRRYTSPSAKRALGYSAQELIAKPDLFNVHPDDLAVVRDLVEPLVPGGDANSAEFRLIHKDGSQIWVEGTFRRLDDGSDGLLSTTRVIAKRKALELALIHALEEAKAAGQAKSDFLANMTHELRTPLNAIIGFSGVLKASGELGPVSARQVDLIADASQTLLGVVNDVLDFSKLEAGAVEPDLHPFNPEALAESTAAMLADQAAAKGVTLEVSAAGEQDPLLGDSARLRQVLLNFLSNAIKFTSRGSVRIQTRQTQEADGRRLRVEVQDSGIGMSPEQMATIFDRFTQADASTSRQYGGTGLGLAISKRIIEVLGGAVGVTSRVGEGSTFWFEITLQVAAASRGEQDHSAGPIAIDPTLRLLVVDDNAINRELICTLLAPFGVEIETAQDGVEAVEAALRSPFDLILMDVQMPNMDGLAATRRIREAAPAWAPRVPIVAMTANVLPEQVARCLEAGMDGHIGKPISPAQLLAVLSGAEG